jgi:hypothetical protein
MAFVMSSNKKITPVCNNITTLGNRLNATTTDATTIASTICHEIANTVTPLCANINMLHNHLNALKDRNCLDTIMTNTTSLGSS